MVGLLLLRARRHRWGLEYGDSLLFVPSRDACVLSLSDARVLQCLIHTHVNELAYGARVDEHRHLLHLHSDHELLLGKQELIGCLPQSIDELLIDLIIETRTELDSHL